MNNLHPVMVVALRPFAPPPAPALTADERRLLSALEALVDWGVTYTSPRDPHTPHQLLVDARRVICEIKGTPI